MGGNTKSSNKSGQEEILTEIFRVSEALSASSALLE